VGIAFRDDVADARATRFYSVLETVAASRTDVDLRPVDYNTLIHAQPQSGLWDLDDTSGRHMTFAGYDRCHNEQEVIERIGYRKDADPLYTSSSIFCAKGAGYSVPWDQAEALMHLL